MIIGKIIKAIGTHEFEVQFENGTKKNCKSCKLRLVPDNEIPPFFRPSSHVEESSSSVSDGPPLNPMSITEEDNEDEDEEELINNSDSEEVNDTDNSESQQSEGTDILNGDKEPESSLTYHEKLALAKQRVLALTGDTLTTTSGNKSIL